jgi:hypothetical protein
MHLNKLTYINFTAYTNAKSADSEPQKLHD